MLAKERTGLLSKRLSVKTLIQYAIRFKSVYERKHNEELESMEELRIFIKTTLAKSLGLSTKTRPKPIASLNDLQDILSYLWMNDPVNFLYERARIQIALLVLILVYTAARPGAIIESHAYYMTGQAMLYKDIKFTLLQNPDGGRPLMSLLLTFNLRKNERGDDGEVYEQQIFEDLTSREMCPVTLFLALAFADDAFANIKNIEELYDPKICTAKYIDIPFKESILDKPLFRNNRTMKSSEKVEALTYQAFNNSMRNLAQRAGFKDIFTSYVIRRTSANILNQHVTSAERGKILGHSNDKIFQNSYLASHSGVDLQSLTRGQEQRTQQINFARSLNANRGSPLGIITKEFVDAIAKDPKLIAATKRIEDARTEGCALKISSEVKRLRNIRRDVVNKHASETPLEQIMGTRFMPPLRQSIISMLYGKEDDLPPPSDLIRSLQKLCQSMGKDVANYRCQNPSCKRYSIPFRCQWELFRHNQSLCQESNTNKVPTSNITVDLSSVTLDFSHETLEDSSDDTTESSPFEERGNFSLELDKGFDASSLLCPHTDCLRHTKPLASKQTLKAHMKTHNRGKLFCPRSNCKLHRHISRFKSLKGFDAHMKYHAREDQSTEESPAEIIGVYDEELQKYVYF